MTSTINNQVVSWSDCSLQHQNNDDVDANVDDNVDNNVDDNVDDGEIDLYDGISEAAGRSLEHHNDDNVDDGDNDDGDNDGEIDLHN